MRPMLLTLCAAAGLASAAEPTIPRFGSTIDVRVVNVEVVVTDRDGQRVSGLGPGDFRLVVDGEPTAIDYFSEIEDGRVTGPDPSAPATVGEPGPQIPSMAGATVGGEAEVGTNYLVFVDEFFARKGDRDRALQGLVDGLPGLGPHDRMAVAAFDGNRLRRLSGWTSSRAEMERALRLASERETGGLQRLVERTSAGSGPETRRALHRLNGQVANAVMAASSSLRVLPAPPGRNVMLLLAGGWPLDVSRLLPIAEQEAMDRLGAVRGTSLVQELVDTANLLGYTIYPVDVPALEAGAGGDVIDRGFDLESAFRSSVRANARSIRLEASTRSSDGREEENHALLERVAEETGGLALINAAATDALRPVIDDTRSFYWLGFTADVRGDDRRRDIRVELGDERLQVRTRQSVLDRSPAAEVTMRVEAALQLADLDLGDALRVELGEPRRSGFGKVQVPVEVKIPVGGMVAVQGVDGFEIRLEMRLGALADGAQPSAIPVVPVVFTSPTPPAEGSFATFRSTVELRRGHHDLVVAAYEPLTDRMLATRVAVDS